MKNTIRLDSIRQTILGHEFAGKVAGSEVVDGHFYFTAEPAEFIALAADAAKWLKSVGKRADARAAEELRMKFVAVRVSESVELEFSK